MGRKINNLKGKKFGILTVIKQDKDYIDVNGHRRRVWLCQCNCGNTKNVLSYNLKNNSTLSCGCLQKEKLIQRATKLGKNNSTHNMSNSSIYYIWSSIKARCNNKNNLDYKNYGGRGIKCLWKSFEEFKEDMYNSYLKHVKEYGDKNTTIDRINNDGDYYRNNCRWSTRKEQAKNKRNNRIIIYKDKEYSITELANLLKLKYSTLYERIFTYKYKDFIVKK